MLTAATIKTWSPTHPWKKPVFIEQDLLLEGILHKLSEIPLAKSLVFIGGTCLHKMHAGNPARYSEDLDFSWTSDDTVDGLSYATKEACSDIGFSDTEVVPSSEARFPKVLFFYQGFDGERRKIKFEADTVRSSYREGKTVVLPLETRSPWLTATSEIHCASLEALAGMKIVAGTSRRKARDWYDYDYLRNTLNVSLDDAVACADELKPSG